ncbi:MAG TPA: hypothetical protein VD838_20580, partial [Anaeromyxobacteraceae bacterium]|nr:hypothetical protein [Anaeromyxobacteraceae bacterium]
MTTRTRRGSVPRTRHDKSDPDRDQFFALKGRKAAMKHVFVGDTRIASKLLPPPAWDPDWSEGAAPSGPIV